MNIFILKDFLKGTNLKNTASDTSKGSVEHKQKEYGIRPEAKDFPMMCVLSMTYVCNAQCPNCPYTNSEIREGFKDQPMMSEGTFKIIADQCGEHGAWIRISGGGEPMLHPKAVELIEYAKFRGAKVGLITNGSKFNAVNALRLLNAQTDMIEFSVDAADSETYAKVRNGLDWKLLLSNAMQMVSLRNSLHSSTRIIASGVNQVGVDIKAVGKFWRHIVDEFQERKFLTWGINDESKSADPTPYLPPEERIPCPFIFERLNIDTRGRVMVCGFDIAGKTDLGNIHKKSIADIWLGKSFQFYRERHLAGRGHEIPLCGSCPDWQYRSWQHNYWKLVKNARKE
jgi:pyruvate-formate lyase-activating enzyme